MAGASGDAPSLPRRVGAAWRTLAGEQRLAAVAALALIATMFLPWYQRTATVGGRHAGFSSSNATAFAVFSWVEGAVLLVALGVLALLFLRGERRGFHLPGGDGTVVLAAGLWAALLLVWRMFDKPHLDVTGPAAGNVGIQWGLFFALAAAGLLAYSGQRMRAAHRPEPPLPADEPPAPPAPPPDQAPTERGPLAGTPPPDQAPTERAPHRAGAWPAPADDLTRPHGSEPPLPRDDLTLELSGDEDAPR